MVGDDLIAEALRLERVGVVAQQLAHPGMDREEEVRIVVGGHLLEDRGQPLQTHARVHAGGRQRRQRPVRVEFELHEHEVPDLHPARACLAMVRHALRPFAQVGAAVEMQLAARPARPDVGHTPPVLLVAVGEVAPAHEPVLGQADLVAPDLVGEVVRGVGRGRQPITRDAQVAGQEVPRPVDRLALEVVAEAPVAEHFEERVMARRAPDLLEVVVLAGHAQTALVVDRSSVRALLRAGQEVLELDHPGVGEEERLVAGGHQTGAGHDRVAALGEELDEPTADLRGGQRRDPGVGGDGRHRHPRQW